jgi:hypothetical protein
MFEISLFEARSVCPTYETWHVEHKSVDTTICMIFFVSVRFWYKKIEYGVCSAECHMEFSMFQRIANCSYQSAMVSKGCPDFSLGCGIC